jgi:hypothetical protein
MNRGLLTSSLIAAFLFFGVYATPRALCDPPAAGSAQPGQMLDYTLHDNQPDINCDVLHMKIPQGWGVKGQVSWNLSVMMPGKWYVCAKNLSGPELWIRYPGQAFIWRDNFNLLGVNFQVHPGDADPGMGDEIEPPLATATDCIKQVILPRFRKDVLQATIVSSTEMTPDDAISAAKAIMPDFMNSPQSQQLQIVPKAAKMRIEYSFNGQTVQEDFGLLALYFDLPSGSGAVHVWCIPYCRSFRAEKGKLDDERNGICKVIDASVQNDPQWGAKRDQVVQQATQAHGDRLRQLAAAQESDIIANMNRNIFNMCQQSYHRRMGMEQQQVHNMLNVINGQSDYVTPDGQTIQAAMAPMGQTAWRDGTGQVKFFNDGVNPNGVEQGTLQELTAK